MFFQEKSSAIDYNNSDKLYKVKSILILLGRLNHMKKSILFGGSILCLFILCSLSYQPIIADTPIETINQVKESKVSNLDVDEIKELYNRWIELIEYGHFQLSVLRYI